MSQEELSSPSYGADAIEEIERLALNGVPITHLPPSTHAGALEPVTLVRDGFQIKPLRDHLAPIPHASAKLEEVASFIHYVNRYQTADTLLAVTPADARFHAILDYHAEPADRHTLDHASRQKYHRRGAHTATLRLKKSPELEEWEKVFRHWIYQETFAEWLEDHAHQVTQPSQADILTIARELSVSQENNYKKIQRQNDGGYNLQYTEKTDGSAGDVTVPGTISISIPLYLGDVATTLTCLLRYRLDEGHVKFFIRPIKLEETLRYAIEEIRKEIAEKTNQFIHIGEL